MCSTAVVAAGASFFVAPAYAAKAKSTGLTLSGSTTITVLNSAVKTAVAAIDQDADAGVPDAPNADTLAANYEASTYAYHVTSQLSSTASKLALVLDSFTAPTGVTISQVSSGAADVAVTDAALVYGEVAAGSSTAPDNTWKAISTNNTATNYFLDDPTSQAQDQDTYVSATQPGTYTFHFVDTGASLTGTDDDVTSGTITMTVLDAFRTTVATSDNWSPTLSVSSSALKLGAPVTASVPLSALSVSDARGSSSGVGILAKKLGALVGFAFTASADSTANTILAAKDLGYWAVTDGATAGGVVGMTSATANFAAGDAGDATTGKKLYTTKGAAERYIDVYNSATSIDADVAFTAGAGAGMTVEFKDAHSYGMVFDTGTAPGSALPAWTPLYDNANNTYGASAVTVTVPSNTVVHASTVTVGAAIDQAGGAYLNTGVTTAITGTHPLPLGNTPSATYTSNSVTDWKWGADEVVGTVNVPAASTNTVAVKTGTSSVTYTATITAPSNALSGQTVYFTVQPGVSTDSVTANGTLVSSNSSTGQKVYSVLTSSTGVASLTVTSSATTSGKTYTIKANLNGVAATATAGTTLVSTGNTTVTYSGSTPATIVDTTPGAGRYPAVGTTSVTLTGQLEDQFGAVAQPDSSLPQSVKVTVAGVDAYVTPVDGKFSYTYTPTTAAAAGSTTATTYSYTNGGTITDGGNLIHWVPTTTAGAVTISAPSDGASTGQTAAVATATPAGVAMSGTVTDGSASIPFKLVTLSGSDGVMFSTSSTGATGIKSTLEVGADASGVFSAYVFYTETGTAKITATADGKSATSTVTTTDSTDPYKVIVKDALARPGGTVTISGEVKDAFGNPVPTEYVDLSIGSTGLGTLTSSNPQTNSGGVFSTTFTTADSFSEGEATITAKLRSTVNVAGAAIMSTNPTANSGWATGGVTIAHGEYMDQATLTVAKTQPTTITAPASRVGAGRVALSGKAVPGVVVEIYSRPAGSSAPFGWVDSVMSDESNGSWSASEWISSSTTFIAKTSTSTSSAATTAVITAKKASVKVTGKALGKGNVKLSINGSPNTKGTITVYVSGKKVRSFTSNAYGDGTLTVKTSRGKKVVKVVFAPKGYTAGSASVTVTVR